MQQLQIEFYNKLTNNEKLVFKAMALKASFKNASQITEILEFKLRITQKAVNDCIKEAIRYRFILEDSNIYSYSKYKVSVEFMLFVFPEMENFRKEWQLINKRASVMFYYENENQIEQIRSLIYSILYDKENANSAQTSLLRIGNRDTFTQLSAIFDFDAYNDVLHNLQLPLFNTLLEYRLNYLLTKLTPLSDIERFKAKIAKLFSKQNIDFSIDITDLVLLYQGDVEKLIKSPENNNSLYHSAIYSLIKNDIKSSISQFDKAIKLQRQDYKNLQTPTNGFYAIYYFVAILNLDPESATIRCQKIIKALEKNSYTPLDFFLKSICHNLLNFSSAKKSAIDSMLGYIKREHSDLSSVFYVLICYLADIKPHDAYQNGMLLATKKAFDGGYYALAYEAAYAIKSWYNSSESIQLYDEIATKLTYNAALSLITRQEDWEKSMNLLLNLSGSSAKKTSEKDKENSSRVIYFYNPNNEEIQPVLQTRNAKGVWSTGRNIALKTFYEAKVAGMTEQDVRISKSMKHYNNYYDGNYYMFSDKSIIELIGHPYIYLQNSKEIPVEFIAAEPIISVSKIKGGYTLDADIDLRTPGVFVLKETNTRYKVYNLNSGQASMIGILIDQKIVVPEIGKDKLIQLLGSISKFATVHSDLLSTSDSKLKVKNIDADNRIRVQLLPFGDGLKAELFAKPFGTHPPYCKPGVGGKVLIANENGEQLQVKRDLKLESEFANALLADIQSLESVDMSDDLIAFENPLDSLGLLDIISDHKDKCVVEWPEGERFKIRASVNFGNLSLRLKTKTNWFELDGELKVDEDTVLSIKQLMELVSKSHDRFIELKDGEFLALNNEMKKRLEELYTYSNSAKDGVQINKFASIALSDFFDDVDNLKADKAWKDFQNRIENTKIEDLKVPNTLQAELRPYQEEGFRWMARLAEWEGGACLADDMGLGKTIQTLAILLHRASIGSALVVCPVSVMGNWLAEIQRFAPTLNIKTLASSNREQIFQSLEAGDVLVSSYGLLQSEEKLFAETNFATVVLDEAHVIKNFATKTSKATMQLKASFRVALTGTPLQNHLGEIWNLFNFVNPGLLGSIQQFNDIFVKPDNEQARKHLRKLIAPFILRRTKSSVLDELPPKTEIVKKIQLSDAEMAFYETLRRQAVLNIEAGEGNGNGASHIQVLAEITKLRQASCNPLLVDANINIASSKQAAFLEIVDELIENKHRALVFSQFVKHLSIMREALDKKGIKYQYLDGSTPIPERERAVKRFQNGEGDLFLISLKAGGLGLNLTTADYVIHLDPWWNPAIEDQASDRAHRIGQKRPVTIYRLVAENTIEEKIIQLHASKRDLAESLLEGSDQSARMSLKDLISLIQEAI